MNAGLILRLFFCLVSLGSALYKTIDQQNDLTKLRIALPLLSREIHEVQEEKTRLRYEIESFENPLHLMQLARRNDFSHLKYPLRSEILTIREGDPSSLTLKPAIQEISLPSKLSLAALLLHEAVVQELYKN